MLHKTLSGKNKMNEQKQRKQRYLKLSESKLKRAWRKTAKECKRTMLNKKTFLQTKAKQNKSKNEKEKELAKQKLKMERKNI